MLRPIETAYRGYRFRSRLEARWAVFFDALGTEWEYEPEGFWLPSGPYLPDFWFPAWKAWGEVKPTQEKWNETQAKELAEATRHPVIALVGTPDTQRYALISRWHTLDGARIDLGESHRARQLWYVGDAVSSCAFRAVLAARSARFEHGERVA